MTMRFAVVVLAFCAAAGCVRAHAWQREKLAKPIMALEPDPEEAALEQHFFQAREGAAGGHGSAGGGCGCN